MNRIDHTEANQVATGVEEFRITSSDQRWGYTDHITIQAPDGDPIAFTKNNRAFAVTDAFLVFGWRDGRGWFLLEADVSGPLIKDDGTYGEEADRVYDEPFGDDDVSAPDWLHRLAAHRATLIPTPPET